jgi:hypothetical protein
MRAARRRWRCIAVSSLLRCCKLPMFGDASRVIGYAPRSVTRPARRSPFLGELLRPPLNPSIKISSPQIPGAPHTHDVKLATKGESAKACVGNAERLSSPLSGRQARRGICCGVCHAPDCFRRMEYVEDRDLDGVRSIREIRTGRESMLKTSDRHQSLVCRSFRPTHQSQRQGS